LHSRGDIGHRDIEAGVYQKRLREGIIPAACTADGLDSQKKREVIGHDRPEYVGATIPVQQMNNKNTNK